MTVAPIDPLGTAIAGVEHDYPGYAVWVVRRVIDGPVWCARRIWEDTACLNAYSEEELREYLDDLNASTQ